MDTRHISRSLTNADVENVFYLENKPMESLRERRSPKGLSTFVQEFYNNSDATYITYILCTMTLQTGTYFY